MEGLCTACLCTGRNLHNITQTDFYDVYTQILNEIAGAPDAAVCLALVCWECRALLRRFRQFKMRAQAAYTQLLHLRHLDETTKQALIGTEPSLRMQHFTTISYPDIKLEMEEDCLVKTEAPEPDEEHCEPETFVNELRVQQTRSLVEEETKPIKEKKKKPKVKKKKKVPNKSKKKIEQKEPIEQNVLDGSDAESAREYENDAEEKTEESVVEDKEVKQFKCTDCDVLFEVKSELENHMEMKHVEPKPVKKPPETNGKRRDERLGQLLERPECFECGKVFSSRKTYRYHLNVLHKGQNRYPCPRCGKVYQWKSNLGRHMRSHKARDSGELFCALCDKRFASVATYRQHLRVSRRHVSESQFSYICHECDKKFVSKTRLRDHIDWEHLHNIKFRCAVCTKPFKCHTSLYVHMQNVHRNKEKKENLCHVCGKSYQNAAKLRYHIVAMHTSETPYRCEQCHAAFGWYSSLYRHVREVHYKVPKKSKKSKKVANEPPPLPLPPLHELHMAPMP